MSARPCSCGAPAPSPLIPTGTYRDGNRILSVGWQCPRCRSDNSILAKDASAELILRARVAQAIRDSRPTARQNYGTLRGNA